MEQDGLDHEEVRIESDDEKSRMIRELCDSKAEEFRLLGYDRVSGEDVWSCVSDKYAKLGEPPLHKMVNDILSLKVTSLMNWMTLSVYKGAQF
ncbi:post-transcriptional regulator [Paenibacillus koleovorans]|uniref:post-transcriptional regulator n=1 Tax=Paenibacillus koleovorans TaxID=121608 RepID=UPI001FE95D9B|nr:post-transcriptional regulator [Paenibacillus koleovorans]